MTNREDKLISIVVPIYFEEEIVHELYARLISSARLYEPYDYEIIFVNDGSQDQSLKILRGYQEKDHHVKIIDLSRNFGHQLAISAGIDYASGDAIVVIDGDLQDPPEVIADLIKKWEEGFHVVYAVRKKRPGETFLKLVTAKYFYRLLSKLSDVEIPLDAGDFRLMDREVARNLCNMREESRYIRGMVSWLGFRQVGVYYERDKRFAGETKYSWRKMISFALDGVTSFSERPLYLASFVGMFIALVAFLWGGWIIFERLYGIADSIVGWSSTIVTILFLGGLQLFFIGIIGQYLGRVYRQSKSRPLYVVGKLYGFDPDISTIGDHRDSTLQPRGIYRSNHQIHPGPEL